MWSVEELKRELRRFERGTPRGWAAASVETYVGRSEIFLRWLAGEYVSGQVGAAEGPHVLTGAGRLRSASVEIRTLPEFREKLESEEGVVVIVGRPSGRVLMHDISCPFLTEVVQRQGDRRRRPEGSLLLGSGPRCGGGGIWRAAMSASR